ncbi:putative ribonuclease [Emiliania huxleyi virus 18]|nr:putative ribonuclease [Emiliania huxleyi virus 18]AHA55516.1 putative ribonuclease [Emiliania huxleyi virus 156]
MDRSEEMQTICNTLGKFGDNIVVGVDEVSF